MFPSTKRLTKKHLATGLLLCLPLMAGAEKLEGFFYGNDNAPGGHEWQSPDSLGYNKEQPRAYFFTFQDTDAARKVLPEYSRYYLSLDGDWKFNWVESPDKRPKDFFKPGYDASAWDDIRVPSNWNIAGIQKDGSLKYGKPIYVNQKVIFKHSVKPDDWRGGVMRTPPADWTTYKDRNEVGSYLRTFKVPDSWKGREVYVNFDGVDSFFYLWINGKYAGFSKNSRNTARFDITRFLKKGDNTIAVEVYRNSDGSFLEAQDMFRLPGIFRSVYLTSTSPLQVADMVAIPDLTNGYADGTLRIDAKLRNLSGKDMNGCRMEYSIFANKLYSDDNEPVEVAPVYTQAVDIPAGTEKTVAAELSIANPNKWSAEQPWRYTLVGKLIDSKGKTLETVSAYTGFRKIELRDTPAEEDEFGKSGRYLYLNGKPIKFKGVNRHESAAALGHAIDRGTMLEEIFLMKSANINHVRNCHYPDAPYWYYLCDKFGIYLEDESNLESHEYYYGDASLSHVPEWEAAHVARNMEMAHSTVNNPSVIIRSLGNEAGPGKNFISAYNAIKDFDSSRPVQYERNNDIVDIGSNQYPSIAWARRAAEGNLDIKYPFHISEYAHSMGNALGGLADYWEAIESSNFVMGGAIWDWIDQSLYYYHPATGEKYLAFGGDFGDTPTDGQFVMNGILFGDMTPKPQYYEVKKVYQNAGIYPADIAKGKVEIFNKNYFTPLDGYTAEWSLLRDGVKIDGGIIKEFYDSPIPPRKRATYTLPYDYEGMSPDSEYHLNIELRHNSDTPWAQPGYAQMAEQILVKPASAPAAYASKGGAPLSIDRQENFEVVKGDGFEAIFDLRKGTLYSLEYDGMEAFVAGKGPELCAFRAYVNNDAWIADKWFENGLYNLRHNVAKFHQETDKEGNAVLLFTIESQAPRGGKMIGGNGNSKGTYTIDESDTNPSEPCNFKFLTTQQWKVMPDGTIELKAEITSNDSSLILPRLGYAAEVPCALNQASYFGRGPEENYSDRMTGQFAGIYTTPVKSMHTDYTRPQSNGNREDVRWAALTDGDRGIAFIAPEKMSFSVSPYSELELFYADHPYKLPISDRNVVHLDLGVTGLGGASCGQGGPLDDSRIKAEPHSFTLLIRPARRTNFMKPSTLAPRQDLPSVFDIDFSNSTR